MQIRSAVNSGTATSWILLSFDDAYMLFKGMVHLIQYMALDDDFGPPDDGQTAILCKKHADFTLFVCKI